MSEIDLELGIMVFDAVSVANSFVEAIDESLKLDLDEFPLDRSTLEAIRQVLGMNARLVTKLYLQNQEIADQSKE